MTNLASGVIRGSIGMLPTFRPKSGKPKNYPYVLPKHKGLKIEVFGQKSTKNWIFCQKIEFLFDFCSKIATKKGRQLLPLIRYLKLRH